MTTFTRLQEVLPENAVRFPDSVMVIDTSALTGDLIDYDSSAIETYARLLQGLFDLQEVINKERAEAEPALEPINLIAKTYSSSTTGNLVYTYTVKFEINSVATLNSVIDPTIDTTLPT